MNPKIPLASLGSILALSLTGLACTGAIDGPPGGTAGPAPAGQPAAPGPMPPVAGSPQPGGAVGGAPGTMTAPGGMSGGAVTPLPPAASSGGTSFPLRRLGNEELINTIADLIYVGDSGRKVIAADLPAESIGETGFLAPGLLGVEEVRRFATKSREAAAVMATKTVPTCAPGTTEEACARRFLEVFVPRAFRRPAEATELMELHALYGELRAAGAAHDEAVRELLAAILQSPQFLYHGLETTGAPVREGARVRLGPYQVASRLSYFFWKTMPDTKLFEAAAAGRLGTPAEVEKEARRLLADSRSSRAVEAFYVELLGAEDVEVVAKDSRLGDFKPALRKLMVEEVEEFVADVIRAGDGRLETLLTAPHTFADATLAKHYGVDGVTTKTLQKILPAGPRAGLLTLGAVMAVNATSEEPSPIKRGAFLRQRILCQQLPPQPEAVPQLPEPASGGTVRERLEQHEKDPACSGCHQLLDPAGYAFSAYDALGRHQATEGGRAVDSSGYVANLDGARRTYSSLRELATMLAASPEVQRCAVRQWFRYALGRSELPSEADALEGALRAFVASGGNVRELLVAVATSPAFLTREALPSEK